MERKLWCVCENICAAKIALLHLSAALALAALIAPRMAGANTIIVDSAGSGQATAIQVGISLASTGDTVRVLAGSSGVYDEAVVLERDVTLECEGPDLVKIRNNSGDTVTVNTGRTVAIRGCTITGAGVGIMIKQGVSADIANNVLWGNAKGASRDPGHAVGTIVVRNNVITGSSGDGLSLTTSCCSCGYGDVSKLIINNIVSNNSLCGLNVCSSGGLLDIEYNNSVGNNPNYCGNGTAGVGSISAAPGFMSEGTGDFRLSSNSTSRNVGKPGYTDPDGTRNDLGAYGGPDAAGFFPSPESGPTIRMMSIFPSSVPKNGTITLQATGQVAVP